MMAKMFYTLDETKAALGKNEEEIKQYAREGRLREFRDGAKLMFKADQVEALKNELGLGGGAPSPDLGPSDSGGPIGLVDSRTGSASSISLVDTDLGGRTGSGAGMQLKDDTALAQDLGLSGSVGGVPSPGRPGSSSGSLSGSRGGSGINVLGESVAHADPMAQTAISSGGSMADQVSLEGVGSGSGLLDLTRESDDTSLGAELLDEIAPGGTKRGGSKSGSALTGSGSGSAVAQGTVAGGTAAGAAAIGRGKALAPVYVESSDAMSPALGGAALGAAIVVLFGGFALGSAIVDTRPHLLETVTDLTKSSVLILAGAGLGISIVFALIGGIIGKSAK
ncbi:MAG TPA: hypothetical protein VHD56_13625 [Tepidisphaeraceae bacterium]|nr:hypothetical protein [Tepidisphaeraceae bacterium]